MIKIYRLKQIRNSVSHVLEGAGGNTVRYNFTGGNVIAEKCPEISLKGKYYQDLLESSELFKNGTVALVREIKTSDDVEEIAQKPEPKNVNTADAVTTPDELLVYINTNYDKKFTDPSMALAFAAKEGEVFANLSLG